MGCASSKLDDLPAVALCRERCSFLDEAIHQRYALAQAHVAYFHSLKSVGLSLHQFFDLANISSSSAAPNDDAVSPLLNLPTTRKLDPQPSSPPPRSAAAVAHQSHSHSHSHSGSHLHFHSDDDSDDDSDADSLHLHSEHHQASPPQYGNFAYSDHQYHGGGGGGFQMNYMRKQPTQSVVYEQRPMAPETVQFSEASSSSASYYPPSYPSYANQNPNPNGYNSSYDNSYSNYTNYSNYGGFFGSSTPAYGVSSHPAPAYGGMGASSSSSSKPPPPPPSPPRGSAWDFFYPFETYEKYYPPYTPSRDSREVREEEEIPDLEDEDDYYQQEEVVKEVVHGNQKFVDGGGVQKGNYAKADVAKEEMNGKGPEKTSTSEDENDSAVEYEVHVVDKKVVENHERSRDRTANVAPFQARTGFRSDSEVVKEIQVQFDRASESGSELAKVLEAGKVPHNRKHAAYQVSAKMLHVITPSLPPASSLPSSSSIEMADPAYLDTDEGVGTKSGNLSSTLHKLYLWEKKLYEEVKVEEKMRILHERKNRKLMRMDEKGAEAHKVDATRTLVRSLSTKIRIAIQVVDKISVKINNLRDGELWPQLNEFIEGLTRMWKSVLECHHSQCLAIKEARRLDAMASQKHFSDAHLEATLQLEHELLNWTLRFSCWVGAQKGYVRALNNWLLKCLLYVPEETPDGIVPFSPGRIGAPPVFVICNQWSQALERISEKEVVDCMRDFATTVLQLWERDKLEMRQRMMANKDMERKVKYLEREDQKIHKEIQVLDKRMVVSEDGNGLSLAGQAVYQSETSKTGSLQISLQRIFEAMEKFTASSLKVYEELLQRIEEDRLVGEQKVS